MTIIYSSNPVRWQQHPGIYIDEQVPPSLPSIDPTSSTVKIIGQFPWGPTDEIIEVAGADEFDKIYGRYSTPAEDYTGARSLAGKQWGTIKVVRVSEGTQAKASVDIRSEGLYTIGTYDTNDDYELTISNVPNGPITVKATASDHASEDDAYTHLESEINDHADLGDAIRAVARTGSDEMAIVGNGDEDWTVSLNTPSTGSHNFASPVEEYTLEANYVGASGNEIKIGHNLQSSGSEFSITIEWGNFSREYGPYNFDGNSDTADEINEDIPFCEFSWHASYTGTNPLDRDNNANLSGGADASIGAGDSQPYVDGLDILLGGDSFGIGIVDDHVFNETANDAVITKAQQISNQKQVSFVLHAIGSNNDPNDASNNDEKGKTYNDDRIFLPKHRMRQIIGGALTEVDTAPFIASAIVNIPPYKSPAAYSAQDYYEQIRAFPKDFQPNNADFSDAQDSGTIVFEKEGGSFRPNGARTSDTSGNGYKLIANRIMADFANQNIAEALRVVQNEPARDTEVSLGRSNIERVLDFIIDNDMAQGKNVNSATISGTTVEWGWELKTHPEMEKIVGHARVGHTIEVDS